MPRKEGQKSKILILLSLLKRFSDEEHPLSVPRLGALLSERGVSAERKSIYTDIEALRDAGYEIELRRGRGGGYYLAERTFQLPELKLLVDAVQASRFITRRQSDRLIKSIESLASENEARQLQRQVFVAGRAKSVTETSFYAVDTLYAAIDAGQAVSFQYTDWTPEKTRKARGGGAPYEVSPFALVWENNCYYLIAYQDYAEPAGIRHYRVDKMARVTMLKAKRRGQKMFDAFQLAPYVERMFGMYGGPEKSVTLRCESRLVGAMLDRFGTGIILCPEPGGSCFTLTVPVAVSPQFYGWVCGFDGGVSIADPPDVRAGLEALCRKVSAANAENP